MTEAFQPPAISVVLVDDHLVFLQSLARVLATEPGLKVVATAGTGAGALEAVRRHEPDVVLLDNALPDGQGTDFAARVHGERPATKVLMLTASEDDHVLLAAIQAGCSGYLTKLKALDEVVAAVFAAHAGEAVMPPDMLARLLPRFGTRTTGRQVELSPRELEVLALMAEGLANAAIAQKLYVSAHTVRNHVQNILAKLDAHSKLEAVSIAVRTGVIKYP